MGGGGGGVGGCTEIITSALLLLFLNWDFDSRVKKFKKRGAGAELENILEVHLISHKSKFKTLANFIYLDIYDNLFLGFKWFGTAGL